MKIRKVLLTCSSILITALLTFILTDNLSSLQLKFSRVAGQSNSDGLAYILIDLALSITLCATVWLMLVWDAGDKLPPTLMLIVGILGWILHYLNTFTDLRWQSGLFYDFFNGIHWLSAIWQSLALKLPKTDMFWVSLFSSPFTFTLSALFIVFGIVGLSLKSHSK
ncbi:MAG: hypothetical protein JW929_08295 [Anaerolineales bacterium]|nr:hypothetical protein [Anaerolineales bacterium]